MKAAGVRKSRRFTRSNVSRALLKLLVICFVVAGCKHSSSPNGERPDATTNSAAKSSNDDNIDIFDPKLHPDATVIHAIDPHSLTESQVKFGVAPKRDPSVEYQPDIILMESGDKAIKSVASDGMTWSFDANAPQVSDFQEGKIVFATGRAVGRVLSLNREGNNVKVILGPVQLTDVIKTGHFEMNEDLNLNNMISYVAPDYPQPPDPDAKPDTKPDSKPGQPKTSSMIHRSPNHVDERMELSRVSRDGKWTPATMVRSFADGHRDSFYHIGRRWSPNRAHAQRLSPHGLGLGFGGATLRRPAASRLRRPAFPGLKESRRSKSLKSRSMRRSFWGSCRWSDSRVARPSH
jgi:hypothetical protein